MNISAIVKQIPDPPPVMNAILFLIKIREKENEIIGKSFLWV